MHISIITGDTPIQLSDAPVFSFEGATVSTLGQQATITPVISAEVPYDTYIRTINGVAPNDRGEFFVDGSACDSWGIIEGGTESLFGQTFTDATDGLSLVDLCPACKTC